MYSRTRASTIAAAALFLFSCFFFPNFRIDNSISYLGGSVAKSRVPSQYISIALVYHPGTASRTISKDTLIGLLTRTVSMTAAVREITWVKDVYSILSLFPSSANAGTLDDIARQIVERNTSFQTVFPPVLGGDSSVFLIHLVLSSDHQFTRENRLQLMKQLDPIVRSSNDAANYEFFLLPNKTNNYPLEDLIVSDIKFCFPISIGLLTIFTFSIFKPWRYCTVVLLSLAYVLVCSLGVYFSTGRPISIFSMTSLLLIASLLLANLSHQTTIHTSEYHANNLLSLRSPFMLSNFISIFGFSTATVFSSNASSDAFLLGAIGAIISFIYSVVFYSVAHDLIRPMYRTWYVNIVRTRLSTARRVGLPAYVVAFIVLAAVPFLGSKIYSAPLWDDPTEWIGSRTDLGKKIKSISSVKYWKEITVELESFASEIYLELEFVFLRPRNTQEWRAIESQRQLFQRSLSSNNEIKCVTFGEAIEAFLEPGLREKVRVQLQSAYDQALSLAQSELRAAKPKIESSRLSVTGKGVANAIIDDLLRNTTIQDLADDARSIKLDLENVATTWFYTPKTRYKDFGRLWGPFFSEQEPILDRISQLSERLQKGLAELRSRALQPIIDKLETARYLAKIESPLNDIYQPSYRVFIHCDISHLSTDGLIALANKIESERDPGPAAGRTLSARDSQWFLTVQSIQVALSGTLNGVLVDSIVTFLVLLLYYRSFLKAFIVSSASMLAIVLVGFVVLQWNAVLGIATVSSMAFLAGLLIDESIYVADELIAGSSLVPLHTKVSTLTTTLMMGLALLPLLLSSYTVVADTAGLIITLCGLGLLVAWGILPNAILLFRRRLS